MRVPNWPPINSRKAGLIGVAIVFLVQLAFALPGTRCEVAGLFETGLICLAPAAAFLLTKHPVSAAASSAAMLPFLLWANNHECIQPYPGGGASMVYVVVFMFGIPFSIIVGALAYAIARSDR